MNESELSYAVRGAKPNEAEREQPNTTCTSRHYPPRSPSTDFPRVWPFLSMRTAWQACRCRCRQMEGPKPQGQRFCWNSASKHMAEMCRRWAVSAKSTHSQLETRMAQVPCVLGFKMRQNMLTFRLTLNTPRLSPPLLTNSLAQNPLISLSP